MRRLTPHPATLASLLAALGGAPACDSGDATCAPGTVLVNGACQQAAPDTSGTDTASGAADTSSAPRDTATPDTSSSASDTASVDTAPPSACTTDEAGSRDFGAACSKDCQCREDVGGYCYSGPFLEGFSFCSRDGGASGLSSDTYPTMLYNSACWDFPRAEWNNPMTRSCNTLDDCKQLSDAYTHCGTGGFAWDNGGRDTQCPNRPTYDDPNGKTTLSGKKVCIIATLPPFDRRP